MGSYSPQLAAELFHEQLGHWPDRHAFIPDRHAFIAKRTDIRLGPRKRNMFAANYWNRIMAAQRRAGPGRAALAGDRAQRGLFNRGL